MSGHSKWANIKRRKGAQDARRAKIFTKLIKEITVAARVAGDDPDANPRLRLAIQNAKGANMPKDTIERAISKGSGDDGESYLEVTYEGYASHGVAIFLECTTDNLNRTVASVRSLFNKHGGSLGKNGSVEYMFDRKGVFSFKAPEDMNEDQFMLTIIDAGAEDVRFSEGYVEVTCAMEDFGSIQHTLDDQQLDIENAELQRIPSNTVELNDENFLEVMRLIDALEDDDDVSKLFHNLEISESQEALIE